MTDRDIFLPVGTQPTLEDLVEQAVTAEEELRDQMGIAGTPAEARDELAQFVEFDGLDAVNVSFPRGAGPEEVQKTMIAVAP